MRPRSPSSSTIRSEAPFITPATAEKPGAALMKPPSRTHWTTARSRSPTAASSWARTLRAHRRAAAFPASAETLPPTLPLCSAAMAPSAPKQTWPEITTKLPVRTNGT
ncbi:hypothetical protein SR39_11835 [Methylobacterium radiotolerans]|nr:hypothetical protein SR39_11835 [Methylobacterium radiotolerans]